MPRSEIIRRKGLGEFEYFLSAAYVLGTVLNVLHIFYPNNNMGQKLLPPHMLMTVSCSPNIHICLYII